MNSPIGDMTWTEYEVLITQYEREFKSKLAREPKYQKNKREWRQRLFLGLVENVSGMVH